MDQWTRSISDCDETQTRGLEEFIESLILSNSISSPKSRRASRVARRRIRLSRVARRPNQSSRDAPSNIRATYIAFVRRVYVCRRCALPLYVAHGDVHRLCTPRVFFKAMYITFVRRAYFSRRCISPVYVARIFEGDAHRICTSRVFLKAMYIAFVRRAYF